jgi:hypothetical protein
LVVADSFYGSPERLIYGLVSEEISSVGVLGEGTQQTIAETKRKPGLPGRYFSILTPSEGAPGAPNDGRIELVGYSASGSEVARIGSREEPPHKPLSRSQAINQGDPAGFAPTSKPPSRYVYQGREITPAEADALHLECVAYAREVRCAAT